MAFSTQPMAFVPQILAPCFGFTQRLTINWKHQGQWPSVPYQWPWCPRNQPLILLFLNKSWPSSNKLSFKNGLENGCPSNPHFKAWYTLVKKTRFLLSISLMAAEVVIIPALTIIQWWLELKYFPVVVHIDKSRSVWNQCSEK